MPTETFANNYVTSLSGNGGSITSGTTTINLASGTGAPSGQARFVIGTEIIIGSVSGTVLTATTRGAESTTAVSHLDGSTVSHVLTVASLLADIQQNSTSPQDNESRASVLVNATSAGDAGNRADHFPGSSLSGWAAYQAAATIVVGNSVVSFQSTHNTATFYYKTYTPSGAFRIEARVSRLGNGLAGGASSAGQGPYFGLMNSSNGDNVTVEVSGYSAIISKNISSSYTQTDSYTVPPSDTYRSYPFWWYLRLDRDGANNYTGYVSHDRTLWVQIGTFSSLPTSMGSMCFGGYSDAGTAFSLDFVDVIS